MLSVLLPVSVFLGIVFALGRMYKDHEIVVLHACGVGYVDFYKSVALVIMPLFAFNLYASVWLDAKVQTQVQSIIQHEQGVNEFSRIKAGQFNQGGSDGPVLFMESISEDRLELRDIIIGESGNRRMVFETARTGRQAIDPVTGDLFLVEGPS